MRLNIKRFIIKIPIIGRLIKYIYYYLNDKILNLFFQFFPDIGLRHYSNMQKEIYQKFTLNFSDSKNLCVGAFEVQENYPYKKYLLEHYKGDYNRALDFACGMGRMMRHMSNEFKIIDGVDLNENNLNFAREYLSKHKIDQKKYNLFISDGISVNIPKNKYDFIYSTIAFQHICVHKIRLNIIENLYRYLSQDGSMCLQFGFGFDNGTRYFDNFYAAKSTNAGNDVCIPDDSFLPLIKKEFHTIGFKEIKFEFKISPHPQFGNRYHPIWLFIHLKK